MEIRSSTLGKGDRVVISSKSRCEWSATSSNIPDRFSIRLSFPKKSTMSLPADYAHDAMSNVALDPPNELQTQVSWTVEHTQEFWSPVL